ncbi:hypothetical protein G7Y89_g8721 [Cudoniella acicularis]|uniref:Glycosyltransferase family 31 protein n=1 Tax=Cudoniella acicularis TaxID=354080 RepID=A0A8H4W2L9_9HELO|nr:hypothetical protein G7Y89_g8721 [Cudoniella acicularis]
MMREREVVFVTCVARRCGLSDPTDVLKTQLAFRYISLNLSALYHESATRKTTGWEDLIGLVIEIFGNEAISETMPDKDFIDELNVILDLGDLDSDTLYEDWIYQQRLIAIGGAHTRNCRHTSEFPTSDSLPIPSPEVRWKHGVSNLKRTRNRSRNHTSSPETSVENSLNHFRFIKIVVGELHKKFVPSNRFFKVNLRLLFVALALLGAIHFCLPAPLKITNRSGWSRVPKGNVKVQNECGLAGGLDRVVITVKTGATEASQKISTQLRTFLRCAPHTLIFSDMEQKLGDVQIYDSLDTVPANISGKHQDFEIYRKQKQLGDPDMIGSTLRNFRFPEDSSELAAWTLDKYKNLHIVEKAWALKPDMDWYLHIDADSYVVWSSLIPWIKKLDPSKESFIGSLALIDDKPFAHGGSGVLLSNAATRNFVVTHNGTAAKWDDKIQQNCCGDFVLARVLEEYGINVTDASPTINGEVPDTAPYSSGHWCQPLVTMHHISPAEAHRLWKFEQKRVDRTAPLTYSELFKDLIFDTIPDSLTDWDNMSDNEKLKDIDSVEDCTAACAKNTDCFQSVYDGEECRLGTQNFRLGIFQKPEDGKKWQSSWNRTRIQKWVSKQKPCSDITYPSQFRD